MKLFSNNRKIKSDVTISFYYMKLNMTSATVNDSEHKS